MTASTTQAKGKAPRRAAAKPKRSGAQKRENRTGWAFMAPFAVLFTFVFILPIIWAIYSSFFRQVTEGGGAYGGGELVNNRRIPELPVCYYFRQLRRASAGC